MEDVGLMERSSDGKVAPQSEKQAMMTWRALMVSFTMAVMFTFIVMHLNLTTGIVPSLNVSIGILGFLFVKAWTKLLAQLGILHNPFTPQENTLIQTCVIAATGIAITGGFGSYILGMSSSIAKQSPQASTAHDIKNPSLGWMIAFLLLVSFLGLFLVVPFRKMMISDFRLTYPNGTATAHLINSFDTAKGAKLEKKQVCVLRVLSVLSFLWSSFQWLYTRGDGCALGYYPLFGLKARENKIYIDLSLANVGVGMICPYIITYSMMVGGLLSWAIIWPLIGAKGDWYSAELELNSLHGLEGYKIFITIAIILGDGLYNFIKTLGCIVFGLYNQSVETVGSFSDTDSYLPRISLPYDKRRKTKMLVNELILTWYAVTGYVTIAIISTVTLSHIFPQLKWYYIVVMYMIAPVLAFCNAYGCGMTNWSLVSTYGKLAIFIVGAWSGTTSNGGIVATLVGCGILMNIVSTASDLMQNLKIGDVTSTSQQSIFLFQVIGTTMGCVISPCVFWIFYKAFGNLGQPGSAYPAPHALVYRNMSILTADGFSGLPRHCLSISCVFFVGAIVINLIRDLVENKYWVRFIPVPMAMAISFYNGSYFVIDMCIGSLHLWLYRAICKDDTDAFELVVASGMICGEAAWTLPNLFLALIRVKPPFCTAFVPCQGDKDSACLYPP